jgi:hypothetical protein
MLLQVEWLRCFGVYGITGMIMLEGQVKFVELRLTIGMSGLLFISSEVLMIMMSKF